MHPRRAAELLVVALLGLAACTPEVGDPCSSHADCSNSGDRLCDDTFPGGYCTLFNCEPGSCPDEAVCVAFRAAPSGAPGCEGLSGGARLTRTFCMKACDGEGDCRGGDAYTCADLSGADPLVAEVVERGAKARSRVCLPELPPAAPDAGAPGVCNPPPLASFPLPPDAGAPGVGGGAGDAAARDGG